jgi:FtsP/CotA-like multicopper oxidase with cupredoxin domain
MEVRVVVRRQQVLRREPLALNYGERLRIVLVNDTMMTHPIHLHGMWSDLEDDDGDFQRAQAHLDMPPDAAQLSRARRRARPLGVSLPPAFHMEAGMMREVRVDE